MTNKKGNLPFGDDNKKGNRRSPSGMTNKKGNLPFGDDKQERQPQIPFGDDKQEKR
jgi:hypothetical protein